MPGKVLQSEETWLSDAAPHQPRAPSPRCPAMLPAAASSSPCPALSFHSLCSFCSFQTPLDHFGLVSVVILQLINHFPCHTHVGLFPLLLPGLQLWGYCQGSCLQSFHELVPEWGPGFYNKIMAGRSVALLAVLVYIATAVGKYFRRKKKE